MAGSDAAQRDNPAGSERIHFAQVDSTNTELARRYRQDPHLPDYTVITADHQQRGRGRYGRTWIDAPGALLASVLVRLPGRDLKWLTAVAGLAGARAVATSYPRLSEAVQLKWPNDIMVSGQKVGGILTEHLSGEEAGENTVIVGIGINFTQVASTAGPQAAALPDDPGAVAVIISDNPAAEDAPDPNSTTQGGLKLREVVLERFLTHLQTLLAQDQQTWLTEYQTRLYKRGSQTPIALPDGEIINGRVDGVDADAHLLITTEDGQRALSVAVLDAPALDPQHLEMK